MLKLKNGTHIDEDYYKVLRPHTEVFIDVEGSEDILPIHGMYIALFS